MLSTISTHIKAGKPINREQASWLFENASLDILSHLSTAVRARFHAKEDATYLIMAIINYTNVCVAKCDYCSFYRLPGQKDTYLLDFDEVCRRIDNLSAFAGH